MVTDIRCRLCGLRRMEHSAGGNLVCSGCGTAHEVQFREVHENEEAAALHGLGRRVRVGRTRENARREMSKLRQDAAVVARRVGAPLLRLCLREGLRCAMAAACSGGVLDRLVPARAKSKFEDSCGRAWGAVEKDLSSEAAAGRTVVVGKHVIPTSSAAGPLPAGRNALPSSSSSSSSSAATGGAALPARKRQRGEGASRLALSPGPALILATVTFGLRAAGCPSAEAAVCAAAASGRLPWGVAGWLALPAGLREAAPMCARAFQEGALPSARALRRTARRVAAVAGTTLPPVRLSDAASRIASVVLPDAPAETSSIAAVLAGRVRRAVEASLASPSWADSDAAAAACVLASAVMSAAHGAGASLRPARPERGAAALAASAALLLGGGERAAAPLAAVAADALTQAAADMLPPAHRAALAAASSSSSSSSSLAAMGPAGRARAGGGASAVPWDTVPWAVDPPGGRSLQVAPIPARAMVELRTAQRELLSWAVRADEAREAPVGGGAGGEGGGGDAPGGAGRAAAAAALDRMLGVVPMASAREAAAAALAALGASAHLRAAVEALAASSAVPPGELTHLAVRCLEAAARAERRQQREERGGGAHTVQACRWVRRAE